MTLHAFFETMKPFLRSEIGVGEVEQRLGPSPTGTEALDLYRRLQATHVRRHLHQMFAPLSHRVDARGDGAWTQLADRFTAAHMPVGTAIQDMGAPFAAWLEQSDDPEAALLAPLADWIRLRWVARNAPDGLGDGFDQRLFVRAYDRDIPAWHQALGADPSAPAPPVGQRFVMVWRDETTGRLHHRTPDLPTLKALVGRQHGAPPSPEGVVVLARLVEQGVLAGPAAA